MQNIIDQVLTLDEKIRYSYIDENSDAAVIYNDLQLCLEYTEENLKQSEEIIQEYNDNKNDLIVGLKSEIEKKRWNKELIKSFISEIEENNLDYLSALTNVIERLDY